MENPLKIWVNECIISELRESNKGEYVDKLAYFGQILRAAIEHS